MTVSAHVASQGSARGEASRTVGALQDGAQVVQLQVLEETPEVLELEETDGAAVAGTQTPPLPLWGPQPPGTPGTAVWFAGFWSG